jgi:hypothetical protein
MSGPCGAWVTLGEVKADPTAKLQSGGPLSDELLSDMIDFSTHVLYRLSGRQFSGVCSDVVRPARRYYAADYFPPLWWRWDRSWGVHTCGRPPNRACGCGPLSELTLGAYPLREINEVRIDGAVVDPSTYRIDDDRWLVRIDPDLIGWPCCQRLDLPVTELDTFQVTFTWGQAPPRAGVIAAKHYAIQLAKGHAGDPCTVPERVLNISVPGATYTLLDPLEFLDKGRTGVPLVDQWLAAVNPNRLMRRAQVISPDIGRPVRRAGTAPGS